MTELLFERRSVLPLYHQLAVALQAAIESGDIPPGCGLETKAQLAQRYGVSHHTVAHAFRQLRRSGHLRLSDSGEFVAARPAVGPLVPQARAGHRR